MYDFTVFKMPKDKYDTPNTQRKHTYMSMEDIVAGKKSSWYELEITGMVYFLEEYIDGIAPE